MRRWVVLAALGVIAFFAIGALADLTQNRPDPHHAGSTRVVLQVRTRGWRGSTEHAAEALWAACAGTISQRTEEGPIALDGDEVQVVVTPGLGEHAQRRLRGCLEDATLDRVLGDVLRMELVPE